MTSKSSAPQPAPTPGADDDPRWQAFINPQLPDVTADLQQLYQQNRGLLPGGEVTGEQLDVAAMLQPTPDGRVPLTVIQTRFLDGDPELLFWVALFLSDVSDFVGRYPSDRLQAAVLLDEAEKYLPATGNPPTREPIELALRRFRSGGVAMLLASRKPADFDYQSRNNIRSWFLGGMEEKPRLKK